MKYLCVRDCSLTNSPQQLIDIIIKKKGSQQGKLTCPKSLFWGAKLELDHHHLNSKAQNKLCALFNLSVVLKV